MNSKKYISTTIDEYIFEYKKINEAWFHGTPDSREVDKNGGFNNNTTSIDYVSDLYKFNKHQEKIKLARESGDDNTYHKLLDMVSGFKKSFTYNKPIFLSNKYSVAKTYADPQRAFDYQNSVERVYEVDVSCDKVIEIIASGDRFRFLSVDKVKRGFVKSGISESEFDKLISMFGYYINTDKGIKTDMIAAIGAYLKFDCIDVIGVLDSYHGGSIKSNVRMVLNPSNVKIKN
jgi:hypothetical protein